MHSQNHLKSLLGIASIVSFLVLATWFLMGATTADAAVTGFDCTQVTQISQSECTALVSLYNSTGGENWWYSGSWLQTTTPCGPDGWYGITCDEGGVATIFLWDNHLIGSLPAEIGNLSNLNYLSLSYNQLGQLSPEIGNLSSLEGLDLAHNQLSSLPSEIGNLSSYHIWI